MSEIMTGSPSLGVLKLKCRWRPNSS